MIWGTHGESVDELIVADPGEVRESDAAYIKHLCEDRKLPIRYVSIRRGSVDQDI